MGLFSFFNKKNAQTASAPETRQRAGEPSRLDTEAEREPAIGQALADGIGQQRHVAFLLMGASAPRAARRVNGAGRRGQPRGSWAAARDAKAEDC